MPSVRQARVRGAYDKGACDHRSGRARHHQRLPFSDGLRCLRNETTRGRSPLRSEEKPDPAGSRRRPGSKVESRGDRCRPGGQSLPGRESSLRRSIPRDALMRPRRRIAPQYRRARRRGLAQVGHVTVGVMNGRSIQHRSTTSSLVNSPSRRNPKTGSSPGRAGNCARLQDHSARSRQRPGTAGGKRGAPAVALQAEETGFDHNFQTQRDQISLDPRTPSLDQSLGSPITVPI